MPETPKPPFRPVLMAHAGKPDCHTIDFYLQNGGYEQAKRAIVQMKPQEVIDTIKASGLRGRGGAGFPCGAKWDFVPKQTPKPKYLVCNADESEPGTFKDRWLLRNNPHPVIEGCLIAAWAVGANVCYIYIRGEFAAEYRMLRDAVDAAYRRGFLGRGVFGSSFNLEITIHRGAGAYICGEETGLLSSLEGKRGYPKIKPPFPAVEGLFGCPTVINNVETLALVPYILANGPTWFKQWGTEKSPGPKIFGVSGHIKRPGLYELPLGTTAREIVFQHAGGWDRPLKGIVPGGSSSGVLTPEEWDLPLDFDTMMSRGLILGTAGLIVMDETVCMVNALWNLQRFYHHESCGQCTPCREGTGWIEKLLARLEQGRGTRKDIDHLVEMANAMCGRTICAFADGAAIPVRAFVQRFRAEFEEHVSQRRCPLRAAPAAEPVAVP